MKEETVMKKYFDPALKIKKFDREAILTASGTSEMTNKQDAENFLR